MMPPRTVLTRTSRREVYLTGQTSGQRVWMRPGGHLLSIALAAFSFGNRADRVSGPSRTMTRRSRPSAGNATTASSTATPSTQRSATPVSTPSGFSIVIERPPPGRRIVTSTRRQLRGRHGSIRTPPASGRSPKDALDPKTPHPGRRAGIPRPSTTPDVRRHASHVSSHDVRLHAIALNRGTISSL